jgi:biopolymer transport protein ExbD
MSLKSRNKVSAEFSMSSMTDIVFLLLIFFMVTSTLIAPNALKLLLPESNSQAPSKPQVTVSITKDFQYFIGETKAMSLDDLEHQLRVKLAKEEQPTLSLHVDKSVPMEEVVKVMNIAKDNKFRVILATNPIR